jgi:glutathione peroxidase
MSVYDYSIKNIEREEIKLEKFKGKVLLIFNSATKCGYTPQYKGIQELYEQYKS